MVQSSCSAQRDVGKIIGAPVSIPSSKGCTDFTWTQEGGDTATAEFLQHDEVGQVTPPSYLLPVIAEVTLYNHSCCLS